MLSHVGVITVEERDAIHGALEEVLDDIKAGRFKWDIALEDVHMNIEQALAEKTPASAKLHTARSRNDQVATDMRLFFKDACQSLIVDGIWKVQQVLVELAEQSKSFSIPGYTHLQRAQPVSIAHHCSPTLKCLRGMKRDCFKSGKVLIFVPSVLEQLLEQRYQLTEFVARELGFVDAEDRPRVTQNSMDAVSDRDVFIDFASACAVCGAHISRLSEDFILWNSSEFGFVALPDSFTTGSSLMPQKKNPDSL